MVSEVGGETTWKSFRFVGACDVKLCERETMMFLSLGFETMNNHPWLALAISLISSTAEFANSSVRNGNWMCDVVEPMWCLICEL